MLLYREAARFLSGRRNIESFFLVLTLNNSSLFSYLFVLRSHDSVLFPRCRRKKSRYRESLRTVQSWRDCTCSRIDLCFPHGMFPQRAHLSSRGQSNNAGSCFSPSLPLWTKVIESLIYRRTVRGRIQTISQSGGKNEGGIIAGPISGTTERFI
jgi:hypothetical protein